MKKPTKLYSRVNRDYDDKLHHLFALMFQDDSAHMDALYVIIKQLAKSGFASEKEIMQEWFNLLQVELQKEAI